MRLNLARTCTILQKHYIILVAQIGVYFCAHDSLKIIFLSRWPAQKQTPFCVTTSMLLISRITVFIFVRTSQLNQISHSAHDQSLIVNTFLQIRVLLGTVVLQDLVVIPSRTVTIVLRDRRSFLTERGGLSYQNDDHRSARQ
jgi:hypothetical protein